MGCSGSKEAPAQAPAKPAPPSTPSTSNTPNTPSNGRNSRHSRNSDGGEVMGVEPPPRNPAMEAAGQSPKSSKSSKPQSAHSAQSGQSVDHSGHSTHITAGTWNEKRGSTGRRNSDIEDEYESSEPKTVIALGHRRRESTEATALSANAKAAASSSSKSTGSEAAAIAAIVLEEPPASPTGEKVERGLVRRQSGVVRQPSEAKMKGSGHNPTNSETFTSSMAGNFLQNIHSSPLLPNITYTPPVFPKSVTDADFISIALQRNFVFANALSNDDDLAKKRELKQIVDAFEPYTVKRSGVTILNSNAVGDYFYVLKAGCVEYRSYDPITGLEEAVGMAYRPGQSFGELCLLYDCPPPANCVSGPTKFSSKYDGKKPQKPCEDGSSCQLWRLDKNTFRQILAMRTMRRDERMRDALKKIRHFKDLDGEFIHRIADALVVRNVEKGEVLFKAGASVGASDEFYIVSEGSVKLSPPKGTKAKSLVLGPGDAFGEDAIPTNAAGTTPPAVTRDGTATAMERSTLLTLSQTQFLNLIGPLPSALKISSDRRLLKSTPLFKDSDFEDFEYELLAALIEDVHFRGSKEIFIEMEIVSEPALFIVREGILDAFSDQYPDRTRVLRTGDVFGEETLTPDKNMKFGGPKGGNKYCEETVEVTSDTAICGKLTLENIDSVVMDLHRLGCKRRRGGKVIHRKNSSGHVEEERPESLEELDFHHLFGAGTFGRVWIVSRAGGGKIPYALKIQSKRELLDQRQGSSAERERGVMSKLDHPFVCKLINTFQDDACIYMLLTFIQGGELLNLIQGGELYGGLPDSAAKFYAAGLVEGLTYMHRRHIIYRDLKPENVLLDKDGYAVIVDFGFSKMVTDKTYTFCGTPLYLAPEIVLSRGHDRGVDYWSLGCLIYEMLFGTTPFYEKGIDQKGLFKRIVRGKWKMPETNSKVSKYAMDLIFGMLQKKPTERLGCLAGGYRDIKNHQWFREVNFVKLVKKQIKAPWVPKITDPLDISNFENYKNVECNDFSKGKAPLTAEEQIVFKDF